MITLTNKQTHYQVAFENELFEVNGTLIINEKGIENLYGDIREKIELPEIVDPENPEETPEYMTAPSQGSFSYSEWEDTYSESISGVKLALKAAITTLIDEIVEEIKLDLEIE